MSGATENDALSTTDFDTLDYPKKLVTIPDRFKTLGEVTKALRENGLELCSLIFGW